MELMFRVCEVGSLPICSCLSENPSDRLMSSGNPDNTSSEIPLEMEFGGRREVLFERHHIERTAINCIIQDLL